MKKSFLDRIKQGIEVPGASGVNMAIEGIQNLKTKRAQGKMIQNYVSNKPSKISTEKRTSSAVINEKTAMDKALRAKMKAKNPSLLK